MWVRRLAWTVVLGALAGCQLAAQQPVPCDNSALNKTYAFTLNARSVSGGTFSAVSQNVGTVAMDGNGNASINVTFNTNAQTGQTQTLPGTYSLNSDCTGTLTLPLGTVLNLIVFNQGSTFAVSGNALGAAANGTGNLFPGACITSTLSGPFGFNANAFALNGTHVTGVADLSGLFQFDGTGNVSATWNVSNGATVSTVTASGQYSLGSNCQGAATLNDAANAVSYALNFSIAGGNANNFDLIASSPALIFSGAGHASILNPGLALVNSASFRSGASAPATIFSLFGQDLASGTLQATTLPLPDTLLTTSVTINGKNAPLFYVNSGQINAEVPVETQPGLATVVVKNGGASSNAAAVFIPAVWPGIYQYGNNHAVVVNQDQNVNAENAPAHVGDTLVAYFCGGGPVQTAGALATGVAAPGVAVPISSNSTVTVSGKQATVAYIGLTPSFVGLYQANFQVPQVAPGDHPLVITINGQHSNAPVITVAD